MAVFFQPACHGIVGHADRCFVFFFNDTATTEIYTIAYTLSLHDALPISEVAVRVEDDGKGFDPHQYLTQSPIDELHFGLFSIRERVAAYGGRLEIKSGEGTVVTVSIPLGAGSSTDNDSKRTNPS